MEQTAQSNKPVTWEEPHNGLFALARRVADNRVIAGVHFDIDNKAGFFIAKKIDEWFDAWLPETDQNAFDILVKAAKKEFPQWAKKPESLSRKRNRALVGKKVAARRKRV